MSALLLLSLVLGAAEPPGDLFVLAIGSNTSVDAELEPLRYADDDAARWAELMRPLGAEVVVLTRADENTRAVHPSLVAKLPVRAELDAAIAELAEKVRRSHAQGRVTSLIVTYAGHGNVKDGEGYLTLEDARLSTETLVTQLFGVIGADTSHFVVDACYSSFLAWGRGPSGKRQRAEGFSAVATRFEAANVGLVLSTGSAKESHEWEGFQAGVFSHEVRSALEGGADADGDGRISYREVAAFVERANQAIANEKYRPDVYVLPPRSTTTVLELGARSTRWLVIDGARAGHYLLEDGRGVRVADVHNGLGETVRLALPDTTPLYLRRVSDSREFELPRGALVELAALSPQAPRVGSRGAAHDAFSLTFSQPFGAAVVRDFRERELTGVGGSASLRRPLGITALSVGAVCLAIGLGFAIDGAAASQLQAGGLSNADALGLNTRLRTDSIAAWLGVPAGSALLLAGLVALAWPE